MHYLPANRFEWWDLEAQGLVPPTGPISAIGSGAGPGDVDQIFYSEFCSPLSTLVGTDLRLVDSVGAGRSLTWDTLVDGASPNALPAVEFAVRSQRPGSVPVIREVEVVLGPTMRGRRKVLVNGVEEGHELDPTKVRPSLFLDFFAHQRAVGLECGFLGEEGRQIDAGSVILVARDDAGEVLVESRGGHLFPNPWVANAVYQYIGARHQGGAIRSVELRLENRDAAILEPQVVYRIWHEPLPPAVVTKGTAAVEFDPNPPVDSGGDGVFRVPPHDGPLGPIEVELPYRCDRAVVAMRGFKMFFLDQHPHKVDDIEALIGGPPFGSDARVPGIFETERGGRATLVPGGRLTTDDDAPPGYRILIYFLVLAWDSDQVDLLPVSGYTGESQDQDGLWNSTITVRDPCLPPDPGTGPPPPGDGTSCGDLSAALQGFRFRSLEGGEEIEELRLAMGQFGIGQALVVGTEGSSLLPAGVQAAPRREIVEIRSLARSALGTIEWNFQSWAQDARRTFRAAQGTILTGRSLVNPGWRVGLVSEPKTFGRRDPAQPFFEVYDSEGQPWSFVADMGFLALSTFRFRPEGKVRELEIEVDGFEYDGRFVKWRLGGGISVSPPVTGGGGRRHLTGVASFGGVVRKALVADTRLAVQHLRFEGAVRGALSLEPSRYGAIRNDGNVPVLLTRAERGGPHVGEYNFLLEYRGDIFQHWEVVDRAPLVLNPGETLVVGGRFFPQVDAGPQDAPRLAWVDFETNASLFPTVRVEAAGHTIPANALGAMVPAEVNFGLVDVDASNYPLGFPTRNVLLVSSGDTPLLIDSLALDDGGVGFSFVIRDPGRLQPEPLTPGVLYQIEEGDAMIIEVRFVPAGVGPVETRLRALTNAGPLEAHVLGDGISS